MCGICGCSEAVHENTSHHHKSDKLINIEENLFSENNKIAIQNSEYFKKNKILALNIMSSPGAGKTTLLTKTISNLNKENRFSVIVGDQQTDLDAEMIKTSGATVLQINTGRTCHLDAHMISHAIEDLSIKDQSILFIENVGNLVCPSLFNLGEHLRIVMLSVTEGDNKPLKYADIFHCADLMILSKLDLLPFVDFDVKKCIEYAKQINPKIEVLQLSTKSGDGLSSWYEWLQHKTLK